MRPPAFTRAVIVAFCLWHMAAVAVYALPAEAPQQWIQSVRRTGAGWVAPYLFVTSQWQSWNLFSPIPLRRVTRYAVETERDGTWNTIETLDWDTLSPFRRSDELKILRTLEDLTGLRPVIERYVRAYCADLPPGARVRMRYSYYVLPPTIAVLPPLWWKTWDRKVTEVAGPAVSCALPA